MSNADATNHKALVPARVRPVRLQDTFDPPGESPGRDLAALTQIVPAEPVRAIPVGERAGPERVARAWGPYVIVVVAILVGGGLFYQQANNARFAIEGIRDAAIVSAQEAGSAARSASRAAQIRSEADQAASAVELEEIRAAAPWWVAPVAALALVATLLFVVMWLWSLVMGG